MSIYRRYESLPRHRELFPKSPVPFSNSSTHSITSSTARTNTPHSSVIINCRNGENATSQSGGECWNVDMSKTLESDGERARTLQSNVRDALNGGVVREDHLERSSEKNDVINDNRESNDDEDAWNIHCNENGKHLNRNGNRDHKFVTAN